MFSLQRILGRPREFFSLLEGSAQQCCNALGALESASAPGKSAIAMEGFVTARRKDKEITMRLEEMLTHVFVTPLEREDLEQIAQRLYVIPKTVEKFAERLEKYRSIIPEEDFGAHASVLRRAAEKVLEMTRALKGDARLAAVKVLNRDLQQLEYEADNELYTALRRIYTPGFPALTGIILKDLLDILEAVMDQCRSAGDTIAHVILKNS
jgi:uncharacterized protein Yka (UPF0111/DUF47 family)